MRRNQHVEDLPECNDVPTALASQLDLGELQLRVIESEINSRPFDSLDFVELVINLEEAFGIRLPLSPDQS